MLRKYSMLSDAILYIKVDAYLTYPVEFHPDQICSVLHNEPFVAHIFYIDRTMSL